MELRNQKQVLVMSDSLEYIETVSERLLKAGFKVYVAMDPADRWATSISPEIVCITSIDELGLHKPIRQRRWWNPLTWRKVQHA